MSKKDKAGTKPEVFLSVIMPIYNAEKYLDESILSILRQDMRDFELILVNDASTDGSEEICLKYQFSDKRVRYYSKPSGGALRARLFGYERSIGRYILFCDADDSYEGRCVFSKLRECVEKHKPSLVAFNYVAKYRFLKRKIKFIKQNAVADESEFKTKDYPKLICSHWNGSRLSVSLWNKLYHRELFCNVFSSEAAEDIFCGDDIILNLHALKACQSAVFIKDALYTYRIGSGGTGKFFKDRIFEIAQIKKHQLSALAECAHPEKNEIERLIHEETAVWLMILVKDSIINLGEDATREILKKSFAVPEYIAAGKYFAERGDGNMPHAALLSELDASCYVNVAAAELKARPLTSRILGKIKKTIRRII